MSYQTGIFADAQRCQYALEFKTKNTLSPETATSALRALYEKLSSNGEVTFVIALGADFFTSLSLGECPAKLHPLSAIGSEMPATHGDVLVWLQGPSQDVLFDAARQAAMCLKADFDISVDVPGFVYRDSRDLSGFVDGSANPKDDARFDAALVPQGEAGAGGSYIFTQRWIHNIAKFEGLPIDEQERVVGRTKPDSIELEGDAMPADSHVSRTDVKVDGVAQKILRRSFPYGNVTEHGLYFLAFACDPARVEIQLQRMFGVSGDGLRDRITEFSKPVTGAFWFAPPEELLKGL